MRNIKLSIILTIRVNVSIALSLLRSVAITRYRADAKVSSGKRSNLGRVHISTRQFVEHFIQSNTIVRFCYFPKIL